jgi:hypothetical protein
MDECEQIWMDALSKDRQLEVTWSDQDHSHQILLQAFPSIIRILQVIRFTPPDVLNSKHVFSTLFKIHFLLDFSWDELRTAICSLRSLIGEEGEGFVRNLFIVALDPTLFPVPLDLIVWDFACGSLHVMQRILRGEFAKYIL